MESFKHQNEDLYELKAQKRVVIRKGKKVKKFVCPDKGYDLEKPGSKKCVKVSASKQLKKEKQARKSAKKAKAKKAMASLKRKKSMKKRKMIHKKFRKEGLLTYADFIESVEVNECWDTHVQKGYKMKGGKRVPNCVPRNEVVEDNTATIAKQVKQVVKKHTTGKLVVRSKGGKSRFIMVRADSIDNKLRKMMLDVVAPKANVRDKSNISYGNISSNIISASVDHWVKALGLKEETKRDYKKEYANYHGKPEQRANRSKRVLARRKLEKEGRVQKGDGKDVDHKDGNPQNNSNGNLRVMSANKNRGRDNNKWRK